MREAARRRSASAYRPGTQRNIKSHVLLYAAFTGHFNLRDFPATASSLVAFGEFLLRSFQAPKSVFNAIASIRHFHLDCELPTGAFDARQLFVWRRAVSMTVRHVPRGAPPLPRHTLRALCVLAARLGPLGFTFAALASVAYFSMARLSSLLPNTGRRFDDTRLPTWGDLVQDQHGWTLTIKWAKAHQEAEKGFRVPLLPISGAPECPVANLTRLRRALQHPRAGVPLFALPMRAEGQRSGLLTMQLARVWLGLLLSRLGLQARGFTFHSFRRGACSRAFCNGADLADIKQLGGWRSDAVSRYLPLHEARRRAAEALN